MVETKSTLQRKIKKQSDYFRSVYKILKKVKKSQDREYRLQAIHSDPEYCSDQTFKIIIYEKERTQQYSRTEFSVPKDKIEKTISNYLKGETTDTYRSNIQINRDLLVCTHEQRDQCCGKFGYPIYKHLKSITADDPKIRIWQSSHISGHRTAPTMIDFPDGRYWGYLTDEIATNILKRQTLTEEEINRHYRGLCGIRRMEQVVEKNGLIRYGWDWLDFELDVTSTRIDDKYRVVIEWEGGSLAKIVGRNSTGKKIGETKCSYVKPAKTYELIDIDQ